MLKKCFKCGKEKPLTEFYKHSQMGDGLLGKCKECTKQDVRERYNRKADEIKEYDRKRNSLPHRVEARKQYSTTAAGKAAISRAKRKYISENPDKRAAHVILGNAVRDGRVVKPKTCQTCGALGLIHGHHNDYAQPLAVEWLCTRCHTARHKMI